MAAATHNLVIDKGGRYKKTFKKINTDTRLPVDLTGYTARMQIREYQSSNTIIVELTTENGGITITPAEGKIDLFISADDTSAITKTKGVYDLELIDSIGDPEKLVRGSVRFPEEVTR